MKDKRIEDNIAQGKRSNQKIKDSETNDYEVIIVRNHGINMHAVMELVWLVTRSRDINYIMDILENKYFVKIGKNKIKKILSDDFVIEHFCRSYMDPHDTEINLQEKVANTKPVIEAFINSMYNKSITNKDGDSDFVDVIKHLYIAKVPWKEIVKYLNHFGYKTRKGKKFTIALAKNYIHNSKTGKQQASKTANELGIEWDFFTTGKQHLKHLIKEEVLNVDIPATEKELRKLEVPQEINNLTPITQSSLLNILTTCNDVENITIMITKNKNKYSINIEYEE